MFNLHRSLGSFHVFSLVASSMSAAYTSVTGASESVDVVLGLAGSVFFVRLTRLLIVMVLRFRVSILAWSFCSSTSLISAVISMK
ncbi:unknown (plasmid) [Yersinia pestis KIM10+]|uniref:Secreted protein n=1 Tax=Yersinia pestis TaxID=632 RepID=Q9ZH00_YERPE|nr:unknown [Yersinia pestis KIM10+]